MEFIIKLLTVLGLGAIELWAAIPAGFALKLHPVTIGITAAIGAMLGGVVVMLLGERVRSWQMQRLGRKDEKVQQSRIHKLWHHYGVIGLGLLAPLLTGAPLGVALGLTLGAPSVRLLFWIGMGIVLWSTVLTVVGALGVASIESLWH
ncbi:MAG: small multi-drug export protein [Bacteroidales bacterium]